MGHWLVVSEYKSSVYDVQRERTNAWHDGFNRL